MILSAINPILHHLVITVTVIASVIFYYQKIHPSFTNPRSFGSILYALLGSLGLSFLTVLFLNALLWVGVWGNDLEVLFTERNVLVYLISSVITFIVSLGYGLRHLSK